MNIPYKMKKRLMIVFAFLVFAILSTVVIAGPTKLEAGSTISLEDLQDNQEYSCDSECTIGGNTYTGTVRKNGNVVEIVESATVNGNPVQPPASVSGTEISLQGGSMTISGMQVSGTATCTDTCNIETGTVNGYPLSNANGVYSDGTTITGTAGAGCVVAGMEFAEEEIFKINVMQGDDGVNTYQVLQGNAVIPKEPVFSGNVQSMDPKTTVTLPNGAVIEGAGNVKITNGVVSVQPGTTISYDGDGDGNRESRFSSTQGSFIFTTNGECNKGNCVDVTREGGELTLSISNDVPDGETASIIHAEFDVVDKDGDGKITPADALYRTIDTNIDSDGTPMTITEIDTLNGKETKTEMVLSTKMNDCTGSLMLPSVEIAHISVDGAEVASYYYDFDTGSGTWSSCVPGNVISPQATGFFGFVGRAWGLITGADLTPTQLKPVVTTCAKYAKATGVLLNKEYLDACNKEVTDQDYIKECQANLNLVLDQIYKKRQELATQQKAFEDEYAACYTSTGALMNNCANAVFVKYKCNSETECKDSFSAKFRELSRQTDSIEGLIKDLGYALSGPTERGGGAPPVGETCSDGIKNQGEEGVDCGGPCGTCPPNFKTAPIFYDSDGNPIQLQVTPLTQWFSDDKKYSCSTTIKGVYGDTYSCIVSWWSVGIGGFWNTEYEFKPTEGNKGWSMTAKDGPNKGKAINCGEGNIQYSTEKDEKGKPIVNPCYALMFGQ
jgi:hypothetical protein